MSRDGGVTADALCCPTSTHLFTTCPCVGACSYGFGAGFYAALVSRTRGRR